MIFLKYPCKTSAVAGFEEQLMELSLSYKSEEDRALEMPVLQEGKTVVKGIENIKVYLEQLVLEIYASRNAAC